MSSEKSGEKTWKQNRDKINIPLNTLKKLALFFDTSIDYLLELTDVSKPYPRKK